MSRGVGLDVADIPATNLLPLPETELRLFRCLVHSLVTIPTGGITRLSGARLQ
jgi:hypothetical protein